VENIKVVALSTLNHSLLYLNHWRTKWRYLANDSNHTRFSHPHDQKHVMFNCAHNEMKLK